MLFFKGESPGQYSYANGNAQALFIPDYFAANYISKDYQDAVVDIQVTRYDPIGGRIQGTYRVQLCNVMAVLYSGDCNSLYDQVSFSGEFDVTRDPDFAYQNQGTVPAPYPILFDFNAWNDDIYNFVGQGESFYELQLKLPEPYQNQINEFSIGVAQPSDDVAVNVYADAEFSQLLCADSSSGIARKACSIETEHEYVYLKVVYSGGGMGAYYTIFSEGASTIYVGEGSVDKPVHFNTLPIVHEGTVNSYTNSFYTMDVTPGATYDIQKYDNVAYRAELYVYDGDIAGDLLCNTGRYSESEICSVTPTTSRLFVLVRGAETGFGTNYKMSIAPAGYYVGEGTVSAPLDLTNVPVSYVGQIGEYSSSVYSVNVVGGTQYTLTVSDYFGYGTISVGSINQGGGYCTFGIESDSQSGACTFTADTTGPVNVYIDNFGTYGTSFLISLKETVYQSLGSVEQPIEYHWLSTSTNSPSLSGEVNTGSSYFSVLLPEDDDNFHFGVYLDAANPELTFTIYDNPTFSTLLCSASATTYLDITSKTCAVNPSTNRMYIKVDGGLTQIGSAFTLRFTAPVFLSQGSVAAPVNLGSPAALITGEISGESSSYYTTAVQPGINYEVKLNLHYGSAEMSIYEDAAMTTPICPPGREMYGFDFSERCVVSPTANQIYVKVDPKYSDAGARFDLSVREFNGDTYYLELVANGIGNYALPYVEIYAENENWVSEYLYPYYNDYPSIAKIIESGKTYLIRVWDYDSIGGSYSINITRNGFGAATSGIPEIPDIYEPMDNARTSATPLMLDEIQDHSFSFNNGNFGDEDWFVFTAP